MDAAAAAAAQKRKRAEQEEDPAPDGLDVMDLRAAKRLLLGFERRLKDNLEARMKHPDDPARFADSELAFHAETDRLRLLAGAPELFPDLVPLGLTSSLSSLLTHDNADLAAAAASLLADLTDSDDPSDLAGVQALADALVDANALDLLVHNLSRLSEANLDEAEAVHHSLAVLENLIDLRPHLADLVCDRTKVLRWLLSRVKAREFEANKQYASEILAILLQNSPANQKRLGQMNGVDGLLQAVAMYKSRDPRTSDEEEMLENLFDCLCCVLMPLENKERFVKAEGVELMIIIIKQKKSAYSSAIRTLDFAMTSLLASDLSMCSGLRLHSPRSWVREEHLTAEEMEARFAQRKVSHTAQVQHFAKLALAHYNCKKTTHKFELSKALTSNCFSEACGTTYAHVNFTAVPRQTDPNDDKDHTAITKRLFFAELMLVLDLRADEHTEPMRVLHVSTIDDVPCYGGCHEIHRKINQTMRGDMDYERCHACHGILKHPKGVMFIGGHNSTRMPYYSAT